jgi:hypothetical protein
MLASAKQPKEQTRRTVLEAIQLWLQRTANQFGKDSGIHKQYRSTFGWVDKDGIAHGILLKFVDEYNLAHPDTTIRTIDQITPLIAQTWHDSHWFADIFLAISSMLGPRSPSDRQSRPANK